MDSLRRVHDRVHRVIERHRLLLDLFAFIQRGRQVEAKGIVLAALVVLGDRLAARLEQVHGLAALLYTGDGSLNSYVKRTAAPAGTRPSG